ncbi:hypothetical protein ABZP36_018682 [Zizania latifolia]
MAAVARWLSGGREAMGYDVVVMGTGPAGLTAAIRLKQLYHAADTDLSICVLEKGSKVGAHVLSGNVFEPRALVLFWETREESVEGRGGGQQVEEPGHLEVVSNIEIVKLVGRYDADCVPTGDKVGFIQNSDTDKICTRTLTVPKHMKSPIHIYYLISGFFQNYRSYVKSRSDKQLRYKNAVHVTKDCHFEGNTDDGAPIVSCGLIAWSMFNDTFAISVNKKTIESDRNNKFGSDIYPTNFQKGSLIGGAKLNESIPLSEQDLIVWMRTAALPTFRKLYGRIETDIMANDQVTVVIQNNYNTYSFGGSKALVLSTTTWIGGKNNFIGVAYLTVESLCVFLAVGFIVLSVVKRRFILKILLSPVLIALAHSCLVIHSPGFIGTEEKFHFGSQYRLIIWRSIRVDPKQLLDFSEKVLASVQAIEALKRGPFRVVMEQEAPQDSIL